MVKPYTDDGSKKEQVALMFDNIAYRYDFLNHFLSLGIDKCWRNKAIREAGTVQPSKILDIATGTGDLTFNALKLQPNEIVGIDISEKMLDIAKRKLAKNKYTASIRFEKGDAENIHYPDFTFNVAISAFGVRNFENLNKGLSEINRVLTHGGKCVILEFSRPRNLIFKTLYNFYFFKIVPFFGKFFSKDKRAYNYLPESVNTFPDGPRFLEFMAEAGFTDLKQRTLSFGIASIYSGIKK